LYLKEWCVSTAISIASFVSQQLELCFVHSKCSITFILLFDFFSVLTLLIPTAPPVYAAIVLEVIDATAAGMRATAIVRFVRRCYQVVQRYDVSEVLYNVK
jgi:hypothetical protein